MKKFGILLLSLCVVTPALADLATNCTNNGGTMITANSYGNDQGGLCNNPSDSNLTNNCNGKRFCRSGNFMNWWSAFTWCEAIGAKLASFESVCAGVGTAALTCPNLKGKSNKGTDWVQTSMGWGTTIAVTVSLQSGAIAKDTRYPRNSSNDYYAICEE